MLAYAHTRMHIHPYAYVTQIIAPGQALAQVTYIHTYIQVQMVAPGQALAEVIKKPEDSESESEKAPKGKLASVLKEHKFISNPFKDVKVIGAQPGGSTMWFN